jgi:pimeloyl-ACP methyl ester carboxylesterase
VSENPDFVSIRWREQVTQRIGWQRNAAPVVVFLHEGLGSIAMWRDFPARLCDAAQFRGLMISRPGYGRSTPRPPDKLLEPDFMHQQALEVLPAVLDVMGVQQAWIIGHSDGGSIALLYGAHFPERVLGLVVVAPHIVVEDISLAAIAQARDAYQTGALAEKLRRYHDDVDSAFWGWNQIWLDPAFRNWDIRAEISSILCPVLAIQGLDDEYGTLQQIRGIAAVVPQTTLLELPDCGHSPHRDQTAKTIAAAVTFMQRSAIG